MHRHSTRFYYTEAHSSAWRVMIACPAAWQWILAVGWDRGAAGIAGAGLKSKVRLKSFQVDKVSAVAQTKAK